MSNEDIEEQAREIAQQLRSQATPKEIFDFKRKHMNHGREPIVEEADERIDDNLENREELVEKVADIVIKGLNKLPG